MERQPPSSRLRLLYCIYQKSNCSAFSFAKSPFRHTHTSTQTDGKANSTIENSICKTDNFHSQL